MKKSIDDYINEVNAIAMAKGGKCLGAFRKGKNIACIVTCSEGHTWETRIDVIRKHWCPTCSGRTKYTIDDMQRIATIREGKCLSESFKDTRIKMLWECKHGHQWEASANTVINKNHWCKKCAVEGLKLTISEMKKIASAQGGKCLSTIYLNANSPLIWECREGHQWKAKPASIKQGQWCRKCSGSEKLTIQEMKDLAISKGGLCISEEYINSETSLLWECARGHRWEARSGGVKNNNSWCPVCYGNQLKSIEEMHQFAASKGGKCLSDKYINCSSKLEWECADGHKWLALPESVFAGKWCLKCSGRDKLTIEQIKSVAEDKGGKCLSEKYNNNKVKLLWQCSLGHQWKSTYASIRDGGWCPICSSGIGERICREYFEQLFMKPFPKSYPKWLKTEDNNQMELDGYCEDLGIAFEHHGRQHYKHIDFFYKKIDSYAYRVKLDSRKIQLCKDNNVSLVVIPEIPSMLPLDDVRTSLSKSFTALGIRPVNDINIDINLKAAYAVPHILMQYKKMVDLICSKSGKCHSENYINNKSKVTVECAHGHNWVTSYDKLNSGYWCPTCSKNRPYTLEDVRAIAEKRGGKCLSPEYKNTRTRLLWECAKGHQWETTLAVVLGGKWCKKCSGGEKSD